MRSALVALVVLSSSAALSARADSFTLSLTTKNPIVTPGGTVTFNGTLAATPGNSGPIFLISDTLNVDSPLTGNDNDFYFNTPTSLTSANPFSGALFTITVPGNATPSVYNGTFIVAASDSQNDLLTQRATFQVTVPGAAAAVTPEPSSLALLGTGLLCVVGAVRKRFAFG